MQPSVSLMTLCLIVGCGVISIADVQKRHPPAEDALREYEISMFFDKALYDKWYTRMTPVFKSPNTRKKLTIALLQKYYVTLINAMNVPFERLAAQGIKLRLVPGTLIIAETEPWFIKQNMRGKYMNYMKAMPDFVQWLKDEGQTFDHMQLHTEYTFNDAMRSSAYARICDAHSVSVVSDANVENFPMLVHSAVEALGHSLKLDHVDGISTSHVMDAWGTLPWHFSPSSIDILERTISDLDAQGNGCLLSRDHQMKVDLPTGRLSANEQCRLAFGIGSKVCQRDSRTICGKMKCCTGYKRDGVMIPITGTACGGNSGDNSNPRMCYKKKCVNHEKAPKKIPGCPYGDEKAGCEMSRDCWGPVKTRMCCDTCATEVLE